MFLKKNLNKVRSLLSGAAFAGVTATALFLGVGTSPVNAQKTNHETGALRDASKMSAPRGGATNKFLDFTGNGTTEWTTISLAAVDSGGPITWRITGNPANPAPGQAFVRLFNYGTVGTTSNNGDSILPADFTGDNKAELAVFRGADQTTPGQQGIWYVSPFPITESAPASVSVVRWGNGFSDKAVTGDYDGDGKADYAVVRSQNDPESGGMAVSAYWYILYSGSNTSRVVKFGQLVSAGGIIANGPTVFNGADFNGDGRDELIYVTRNDEETEVNYFVGDVSTGAGLITRTYGNYNTDYSIPPADYTGDGRADFVACRQETGDEVAVWYIMNSATGVVTSTRFGIAGFETGDLPVRGDYDGDNRHDIAVWRPSNQTFYYISSQFNNIQSQKWGVEGETPLALFGIY